MADRNYAAELSASPAPMPQPTYAQRLTFESLYPSSLVNSENPLPSYNELQNPAPPDLAPTQFVKGMAQGIGDVLMQANEAMPWGGNNPQAIGYDPQAGTIDPSVMVPFATNVAGMATTGSLAAPAVQGGMGMGIRAYHGSPHDFDRFSMDKIGTGEGAQAYGHGLYFAENEGVARSYRDSLAGNISVDGKPLHVNNRQVGTTGDPELDDLIISYDGDIEKAIANADPYEAAKLEPFRGRVTADNKGRMYEVDINASPDEFLDWDKPLSEQPPKVREAVKASYGDIRPVRLKDGSYSVTRVRPDGSGDTIWDVKAATADEALAQFDDWLAAASGRDVYQQVARGLDVTPGSEQGAATGNFRNAGIKGIRYKDAGSRGADAEGGTSNFVVFDDNIIDILKKYGIAGLVPVGGAGAAMLGGTQDASAAAPSYTTGGRF